MSYVVSTRPTRCQISESLFRFIQLLWAAGEQNTYGGLGSDVDFRSQPRSRILDLNPDHEFWVSIGPILNHCIPLHLLHHTITTSNWLFALLKSSSHFFGSGFHVGNLCRMRISNLVTSCEDHWSP